MRDSYVRAVSAIEVIDGDTFRCVVDLGFYVAARMSCRLVGINAPDRGEGGYHEAAEFLTELLARGEVTVESVKADKYAGRFDAAVVIAGPERDDPVAGRIHSVWSANAEMVQNGYAVPWNGHGPRPLVPWPRADAAMKT